MSSPAEKSAPLSSSPQPAVRDAEASPTADAPPRRAMTFEEFRTFYAASRAADFARQKQEGRGDVHHPLEAEQLRAQQDAAQAAERLRRRRLAAELTADLTAMAMARHGGDRLEDQLAYEWGGGRPPQPAAAAAPAMDGAQQGPGVFVRVCAAVGGAIGWLLRQAADNVAVLVQVGFLGYLVYSQSNHDSVMLGAALVLCGVFYALRALVRSFRIGHETGAVTAPSFLGRLFRPEGQAGPVLGVRRAGYMVAKCVEALLLSVFPTYSVERLETELQADGIVR